MCIGIIWYISKPHLVTVLMVNTVSVQKQENHLKNKWIYSNTFNKNVNNVYFSLSIDPPLGKLKFVYN